mgnify:CR=1 FL=1
MLIAGFGGSLNPGIFRGSLIFRIGDFYELFFDDAKIASKIADRGINIIQVVAEDPELYPEATLTIITERPIPGELINELSKLEGVKRISIY